MQASKEYYQCCCCHKWPLEYEASKDLAGELKCKYGHHFCKDCASISKQVDNNQWVPPPPLFFMAWFSQGANLRDVERLMA
jgi:hypothetical protein